MRSTKYHDYRVLKIALFIILVILGLFIYIKCTRALHEHTATQWTTITEATCTEDGLEVMICTDPECEGLKFEERVIPKKDHNPGRLVVAEKPTCTEKGVMFNFCQDCGYRFEDKTEPIDELGHNMVIDKAKESTCTATGLTEGEHCTRCDYKVAQETVPANGHKTADYTTIKEPTCTVEGLKVKYCTVCNAYLEETEEAIAVVPHPYVILDDTMVVTNQPTCTQFGDATATAECTECGDTIKVVLNDAVEPTGHNYTKWELKYDSETGEFTMIGTCDCDEEGNVVYKTHADGVVVTSEPIPNCCADKYKATVTFKDAYGNTHEAIAYVELETKAHKIIKMEVVDGNELKTVYVPISEFQEDPDPVYGVYYDISTENLYSYVSIENEWDENGFAKGVFKCVLCEDMHCPECNGEYWYVVTVYNSKYDTRLSGESVDN